MGNKITILLMSEVLYTDYENGPRPSGIKSGSQTLLDASPTLEADQKIADTFFDAIILKFNSILFFQIWQPEYNLFRVGLSFADYKIGQYKSGSQIYPCEQGFF